MIITMSVGKPILFYSKTCPNSQQLWSILQNDNRLHDFIKIPIEDNSSKIPPYIREVPAIFVSPQQIYTGMSIHNFLGSLPPPVSSVSFGSSMQPPARQIEQQSTTYTPINSNQPRPSGNIDFKKMKPNVSLKNDPRPRVESATNGKNGIDDFIPSEMSGAWSDSYSFLSDNPAPMLMNFDYINDSVETKQNAPLQRSTQVMSETERRYHEMQQARALPIGQRQVR
jgi:hypothetical protein